MDNVMTYIKPPLKRSVARFIIYAGTNDLRSDQNPEIIVINIVEVANNSKTDASKVFNFKYSSST